jgi:cytochrome c peroxidase
MRRKRRIVIGTAVIAASALAGSLLGHLYGLSARGGGKQAAGPPPPATFGPIPCQGEPADIVALTPLELLGKKLIYDCQLSDPPASAFGQPGYACATCHVPSAGFTGPISLINQIAGPQPGVRVGRFGKRRPQTYAYATYGPEGPYFDDVFAMAYVGGTFWDGRTPDNAGQARMPFLDPNEMANIPTNGIYPPVQGGYSALVARKAAVRWRGLFEQAYGQGILERSTPAEIYTLVCQAIAAFEASAEVNQFSSKFDASPFGVPPMNLYELTASEENGRQLYFGKAICNTCHSSANDPPVSDRTNGKDTFTMYCFANIGVPRNAGNPFYQETDCVSNPHGCNPQGTNFVDFGLGSNPNPGLDGTQFFIKTPGDVPQFRGLFQTPTVRNVDLRPSPNFVKAYMHNGVFKSLAQVVRFYNKRNIAVNAQGKEVAFDLRVGPPQGYTRLFPPPEVLDNVQNVAGDLGNIGNLGLSAQQESDLVAFQQILSDGFTLPNPPARKAGPGAKVKAKLRPPAKPRAGSGAKPRPGSP